MIPVFLSGFLGKASTKIIIALLIILAFAALWIRGEVYRTKYVALKPKYDEKVKEVKKCGEDLITLRDLLKEKEDQNIKIQKNCNKLIAKYESRIFELEEACSQDIILQVVDRPECPKVIFIKDDPLVERLKKVTGGSQ